MLRLNGTRTELYISMNLTDKGVKNVQAILRLIFSYINCLKEKAPPEHVFQVLKSSTHNNFENTIRNDPKDHA